jgi:hemoglobin-like flavoprotein
MNATQIDLVRSSFARVQPIADAAAAIFYEKLFGIDPTLRPLFKGDIAAQGQRLMSMIAAAVRLLDRPEQLLPVLRGLGARHAGYGVQESHYATVGEALVDTLREGLGAAFTAEVCDAWITAYGVIARTMQEGAREAAAIPA